MRSLFNRILKWMPVILFFLLLFVDRTNLFHVIGYIALLFSYTSIIILRVLYAKKQWHKEFNDDQLDKSSSIKNMSDFKSKLK
ncbi:hypothetical protein OAN38_01480 [Candidatus Marinimicrobia bacterium]|nr:hypothetical protein [Candidatus Neomarinimicrobiota bacterium]